MHVMWWCVLAAAVLAPCAAATVSDRVEFGLCDGHVGRSQSADVTDEGVQRIARSALQKISADLDLVQLVKAWVQVRYILCFFYCMCVCVRACSCTAGAANQVVHGRNYLMYMKARNAGYVQFNLKILLRVSSSGDFEIIRNDTFETAPDVLGACG